MSVMRTLKVPTRKLTDEERRRIAENVEARLSSPEGQEALRQAGEAVNREITKLREARKLDPEELRRPFDI